MIKELICEYIKHYPIVNNTKTKWEEPLVAYADAHDKMFNELKIIVSPTHALPTDFMQDAKSVVTYFIPFEKNIPLSNKDNKHASREWAVAYIETNKLISDLNNHIIKELTSLGFYATNIPATHNFDQEKLISDWSHRHVAFISGLGKFGINNMLITEKGCCGRVGSIVTTMRLDPSERHNYEFCLYKYNRTCQKCVKRCVNGALSLKGFDRKKCYEMCLDNDKRYNDIGVSDVCGKCLVDVPCAFVNPVKQDL